MKFGSIAAAVTACVAIAALLALGGCGSTSGETEAPVANEDNAGIEVKGTVNDYSWEELAYISAEISKASDEDAAVEIAKGYNLTTAAGKLDGTQLKDIELADGTKAQVQIAGFFHDDLADGGKAGMTFIFKNAIGKQPMNSSRTNAGGWEGSEIRSWLESWYKGKLPQDLINQIAEVHKQTNNAGETDSSTSVSATSDKVWLFSLAELVGDVDESEFSSGYSYLASIYDAEGSQYKLFSDSGVTLGDASSILVKDNAAADGTVTWWLRTPFPNYSYRYQVVSQSGSTGGEGFSGTADGTPYGGDSDAAYSVVPGFCI